MTKELNQAQVERFPDNMLGMLNSVALALMTRIGQRTGLFDTTVTLPPAGLAQHRDRLSLPGSHCLWCSQKAFQSS
jgi:hypothetical protein